MKIVRWRDLCPRGEAMHVSFVERSGRNSWPMHGHDYHEIFWVDSGLGEHVVYGGEGAVPLVSGQLVYIRAHDHHAISALASSETFSMINIAFASGPWRDLRTRYGLAMHPFLNDSAGQQPVLEADAALHRELSAFFNQCIRRPVNALNRDAFLLGLAARTSLDSTPSGVDQAPVWLQRGLWLFARDPQRWACGSAALARLCGCSRTHLARVMRAALNEKPSAWILRLRLDRAARLLESTGFSVSDVAIQSGFENLSHFHRCFAERFGQSPLRYRKAVCREAV